MSDIVDTTIDAEVQSYDPDANFETGTTLRPHKASGWERRVYLAIPAGSIPSAYGQVKLWLYQSPAGSKTVYVSRAGSTWDEATLTWNNQPNLVLTTGPAIGSFWTQFGWTAITLPNNINLERGVVLWCPTDISSLVTTFFSSENGDADHRPYFEFIPSPDGLIDGVGTPQINYFNIPINAAALESPWEWFQGKTITVAVDPGCTATLFLLNVWFDIIVRRLELIKGERVAADVAGMLDGGSLVTNPAAIIEKILTDQLGVAAGEIDSAAFTAAKTALSGHDFAFALTAGVDSRDLLAQLAFFARAHLWAEVDKITMKRRATVFSSSARTIDGSNRIAASGELIPLGLAAVKNRIVVKYDFDPGAEGGEPFRKVWIAEDLTSQAEYDVREQVVEAWPVREDEVAENLANFLLITQKDSREMYICRTGFVNADVERGDVLAITESKWNLSGAVGTVVGIAIQPGVAKDHAAGFVALTVALEPYRFTYGNSNGGYIISGENAFFVIGQTVVARLTSAGVLYIRGYIKENEPQQAATSANPVWHDTGRDTLCFALNNNTRVMEIDSGGNLLLPGYYKEDETISQAGNDNEITSDGSNAYFNIDGTRSAVCSATALAVAGHIVEDGTDQQLL